VPVTHGASGHLTERIRQLEPPRGDHPHLHHGEPQFGGQVFLRDGDVGAQRVGHQPHEGEQPDHATRGRRGIGGGHWRGEEGQPAHACPAVRTRRRHRAARRYATLRVPGPSVHSSIRPVEWCMQTPAARGGSAAPFSHAGVWPVRAGQRGVAGSVCWCDASQSHPCSNGVRSGPRGSRVARWQLAAVPMPPAPPMMMPQRAGVVADMAYSQDFVGPPCLPLRGP
jgi:hypothetical protein